MTAAERTRKRAPARTEDDPQDKPVSQLPNWVRFALPLGAGVVGLLILVQLIGAIGFLLDGRDRDLAPPLAGGAIAPAVQPQQETTTQVVTPAGDMLEAQKRLWDEVQGKYLAVSQQADQIDEKLRQSRVAAWQQFCNQKANEQPDRYASGYDCLYKNLLAQVQTLNQYATYLQNPTPEQSAQLNQQLQQAQVDQIRVYAIKTNTQNIEGYRAQMQVFLDLAAALSSKPGEALPTGEISTQTLGEAISTYVSTATAFNKLSPEIVQQVLKPSEVASNEAEQP